MKDLICEVSDPSICLQFLLFLNNRSIVHFCEWRWVVCGHYNCMIPNIKTYLDKKVTFLALMSVLSETAVLAL